MEPEVTPAGPARIGLVWRRDESAEREESRLQPIFAALRALGVDAVPVLYSDEAVAAARAQLLQLDGVLVWVDPMAYGRDRSLLDPLLREVAGAGVYVSADPDVILKMGTKEVLFTTRRLDWGTETQLYRTPNEFREHFPSRLATAGPRVLKQYRGNGGTGVWKIELLDGRPSGGEASGKQSPPLTVPVRVLEARRDSLEQDMPLDDFMNRCADYFAGSGRLIDQPFQDRLPEGMIRCYLSQETVIGFTHQMIRGLMPVPESSDVVALPQPGPRIMQAPSAAGFEALRKQMESNWVPGMCAALGLQRTALPALWDADFLLGSKADSGDDSYVLCEINVSCVTPYPEFAAGQIAETALARTSVARQSRV
jgi:hypothetical protein